MAKKAKAPKPCWVEGEPTTYGELEYEANYRMEPGGEVYTKLVDMDLAIEEERKRRDATTVIPTYPA